MTASEVKKALQDNLVGYFITTDPRAKVVKLGDLIAIAQKMLPDEVREIADEYIQLYAQWRAYHSAMVRGGPILSAEAEMKIIGLFWRLVEILPSDVLARASEESKGLISSDLGKQFLGGESTD